MEWWRQKEDPQEDSPARSFSSFLSHISIWHLRSSHEPEKNNDFSEENRMLKALDFVYRKPTYLDWSSVAWEEREMHDYETEKAENER